VRAEALRAHATQVDPSSRMWFGLPPEVQEALPTTEEYQLGKSRVGPVDVTEDDLFAGVDV
jgi:mycothiol S-conjugate amidase